MKSLIAKTLLLGLTIGYAVAATAADDEETIKYRKNVMKSFGAHMAGAGALVQGKVDYKGQLAVHANALEGLTRDIPALFPKGSDFGETSALPAVWSKRADFEKRAKDTETKAAAFAKVAAAGDAKAAGGKFKELSESCKACHKDFRKEEK